MHSKIVDLALDFLNMISTDKIKYLFNDWSLKVWYPKPPGSSGTSSATVAYIAFHKKHLHPYISIVTKHPRSEKNNLFTNSATYSTDSPAAKVPYPMVMRRLQKAALTLLGYRTSTSCCKFSKEMYK